MTPAELDRIGRMFYGTLYAADLARALGITPRSMNRYITGERSIPDDMKVRLARLASKRVAEITRAVAA